MQTFTPKRTRVMPWLLACSICILIILGLISPMLSYAALLVCLFMVVFGQEHDTLCALFMAMSFANIFKASPGSQSFFTYTLLFYVLWHFVRNLKVSRVVLLIFVYAFYLLAVQLAMGTLSLFRYIKYITNFLFLYYAFLNYKEDWAKDIFLFYILGVLLSSLVKASNAFPQIVQYIGEKDQGFSTGRAVRFAGLYTDPNYYSINIIISMCLTVILYHKRQIGFVFMILCTGIFVVFSAMTCSKSAMLMLAFPASLLFYSNKENKRHLGQLLFFFVLIVLVLMIVSGRIDIFNRTLERFSKVEDANSLTTGRSDLWKKYIEYIINNTEVLLFGGGIGAELLNAQAAHNTYIDMVFYLGLCGVAMLFAIIIWLSKMILGTVKRNFLNYGVLGAIVAMYLFLGQLFYFDFIFQVMLAIMVFKMNLGSAL